MAICAAASWTEVGSWQARPHWVATMALADWSAITDPMSNVVSYVYDRNGNVTRMRYFGETNDVPGSAGNRLLAETRFTYDSLDRCVQQVDSFFDIFTELPIGDGQATTTFSYAPNGACTSVTDDNGHTTRFTYDALGRWLPSPIPRPTSVQFTYDACDNLTSLVSERALGREPGLAAVQRGPHLRRA